MQGKAFGTGLVLLLCFFAGCTNGPPSPLSSIPMLLIDHIEENKETKVYVHGLDDYRFSNITIQINNVTATENFTYALHLTTILDRFILNVSVWDDLKQYEYAANLTILTEDNEITLQIEDERHDDTIERSLPYTLIMERKE
ncbi:MAG: hypothetical protein JSW28_10360 [Thermoplasmata archaeon]|nr:MAG: hypothetical protein JSW28_10360 [Thermoplasmata archaeon]